MKAPQFAKKYIIAKVLPHQGREKIIRKELNDSLINHFIEMNEGLKPTLQNIRGWLLHDYQKVIECKYTNDWFVLD